MSIPKRYNSVGGMEWASFDSFDRVARCPNCGRLCGGLVSKRITPDIKQRYHSCPACKARFKSMETRK